MGYEWNQAKARANLDKHGIDFADAAASLEDDLALSFPDPDSRSEDRFVCLGIDATGRLLVTVYAIRGHRIRIISARKATPGERRRYQEQP